ncbi:outer membrane beta-barrel protein [Bacteroidota bacterium]
MKFRLLLVLVVFCSLIASQNLTAGTGFGLFAGLSAPNDQMNNIYNSSKIEFSEESIGNFIREGTEAGYHIGAKVRFSLAGDFMFTGSAAWHKFPQSNIDVMDPVNDTALAVLTTTQNIIPITVGMNYYIINSTIGVYGTGELSYNYIYNSVDADYQGVPIPLEESPTDSRVGFGLGAGVDFDATLVTLNLEAKYSIANLIGKESGEETKSFFSLSLGIFF